MVAVKFAVQCCFPIHAFFSYCNTQDKENQEDAPEHQEDADTNELPETSFQVPLTTALLTAPILRLCPKC